MASCEDLALVITLTPEGTRAKGARAPAAGGLRADLAAVWRPFWTSRVVVFLAGVLAVPAIGNAPGFRGFDPVGLTTRGGAFGNLLAAPFARWDSVWYLAIAQGGYHGPPARTAFFPLLPLLLRGLGFVVGSQIIAGVLISLAGFLVALVLLRRLVILELGEPAARVAVTLLAFAPVSYFFSALYTESLFLALSLGCVLLARRGRWGWGALLGGLAAASRNSGVLLAIPFVLLYLYPPGTGSRTLAARLRPRRRPGPSLAYVLLIPAGLGAYLLYLGLTTGDALSPFHVQQVWFRHFAGPFGGVVSGAVAAWDGLRQLAHGPAPPVYFKPAGGDAILVAGQNVMLFGFLLAGAAACLGALRRLPIAYGAYALASLALPLSYPVGPQPLASLPRYEVVVFPLFMWAALAVSRRRSLDTAPAVMAVLLGLFTAEFATWRFVA